MRERKREAEKVRDREARDRERIGSSLVGVAEMRERERERTGRENQIFCVLWGVGDTTQFHPFFFFSFFFKEWP